MAEKTEARVLEITTTDRQKIKTTVTDYTAAEYEDRLSSTSSTFVSIGDVVIQRREVARIVPADD